MLWYRLYEAAVTMFEGQQKLCGKSSNNQINLLRTAGWCHLYGHAVTDCVSPRRCIVIVLKTIKFAGKYVTPFKEEKICR